MLRFGGISLVERILPVAGFDTLSGGVLILALGLNILIVYASSDFKKSTTLVFLYFILGFIVGLIFSVCSLLWFYILFELRVIPLRVIVLGWGAQPERLLATLYILLFTSVRALPFVFLVLISSEGSNFSMPASVNSLLILPFLIKLPVYIFHI